MSYTTEEMAVLRQAIRDHRVADHVTDMVGVDRVMGHAVYARKCPNCGRFARPVRGNDVSGRYWMDTHCAQCGDWRVTGHPAGWGAGFQSSKLEEPISFAGIAETYDEIERWWTR